MNDSLDKVLALKGRHVETTRRATTVAAAVDQMNERRIGSLVVLDGDCDRVIGIVTERDVLVRVVALGRDPATTEVGDVMTGEPITVRSTTTVAEAMQIVHRSRCRHLPVIDGGRVTGLISIGDLNRWMLEDQRQIIDDLHGFIRAA